MKSTSEIRIKNCPMCGSKALYCEKDGKFTIFCENCLSKSINISVSSSNVEEAVNLWNDRPVFNKITEDYKYLNEFLEFYNGEVKDNNSIQNLQKNENYLLFSNLFYNPNQKTSGCLITRNGEVLHCLVSHLNSYREYMNLDEIDINSDILDKAIHNGFIRVSFYGKYLVSELNKDKVNSKQIMSLYEYIEKNKDCLLKNITTWGLSYTNKQSSCYSNILDYLNAILFIDN